MLSVKAGLRAAEIANLNWDMVLNPIGGISSSLELWDTAAKMGHGRIIPLHSDLREALAALLPAGRLAWPSLEDASGINTRLPMLVR
jgi:hypothetical protein